MAKYITCHRRGTASDWAEQSTLKPLEGEIVIEIDEVNLLHKLKIGDGIHTYAELAYLQAGDEIVTQVLAEVKPRIVTVELAETWNQDAEGKYSQVLALDNVTEHSRLDLQPSADMLAELKQLGVVFITENNGGVITVYSVGNMPSKSYAMQATIVETECDGYDDPVLGIPVGAPATPMDAMTSVTYSELKSLRNNSELIPGHFYRITDYECTTAQEGTRAMNNRFDIIVQALSKNTLSENAKADYHSDEQDQDQDNDDETPSVNPTLSSSVIALTVPGSVVIPYYYEFIDCDGLAQDDGLVAGYDTGEKGDIFIDYDYLPNNDGDVVPVIYKTSRTGFDSQDEEYGTPDKADACYYVGTAELNGTLYDKWRKINSDGFNTWEADAQIYIYTNILVRDNTIIYDSFITEVEAEEGTLVKGAITVQYREFIDYTETESYNGLAPGDETQFVAYDYLDYKGLTVPVLYEKDPDSNTIDTEEPFYYVNTVKIGGITYDKWRNVEYGGGQFEMDSDSKLYYYTNAIVENGFLDLDDSNSSNNITSEVAKVPAWELKYCLDNDTTRFAWACTGGISQVSQYNFGEPLIRQPQYDGQEPDGSEYQFAWGNQAIVAEVESNQDLACLWYSLTENVEQGSELYNGGEIIQVQEISKDGKGVIYYMKDEWGNECPYDFKNIQFQRSDEWQNNHPKFLEYLGLEQGIIDWFYTFSWIDTNLQVKDLTTTQNLQNDEGRRSLTCNNQIKPLIPFGECLTLNNNILVGAYAYDGGIYFGLNGNNFDCNCENNTVSSTWFYDNFFESGCINNFMYGDLEVSRFCQGLNDKTIQIENRNKIYRSSGTKEIILD